MRQALSLPVPFQSTSASSRTLFAFAIASLGAAALTACKFQEAPQPEPELRIDAAAGIGATVPDLSEPMHVGKGDEYGESISLFGRYVSSVDDCDGDGLRDYAVSIRQDKERGDTKVRFFSSRSGAALFEIAGDSTWALWPLEDIDGDGAKDLAVHGDGFKREAVVISVGKRRVLYRVPARCEALLTCIDLNGDGGRDLLAADGEALTAFSGRDGVAITTTVLPGLARMIPVRARTREHGNSVLGVVEDSQGEVLAYDCTRSLEDPVQAVNYGRSISQREPHVERTFCLAACSTAPTLDLIECGRVGFWTSKNSMERKELRLSVTGSDGLGKRFERTWEVHIDPPPCPANSVAPSGDLDGDGIDDVIVGDPSWDFAGGVYAHSGKDGSLLWKFAPLKVRIQHVNGRLYDLVSCTGVSLDVLDDLDGDGVNEVLVGCGSYCLNYGTCADGAVLVLSGRTGKLLSRIAESDVPLALR